MSGVKPVHRRWIVATLLLATPALTACNSLGSASEGQNFISVDGTTITEVKPADRAAPIDLSGTTLDGKQVSLSSYRGKPVVVNIWGSWCGPCIKEGPIIAQAAQQASVPFLGIDIRDTSADNARSFNTSFGITYPSIYDPSSTTLLNFRDYPVQNPPTTFVLDGQGRVAAVVVNVLPSSETLLELIDDVKSGT